MAKRAEDSIPSSLAVARATVPDERGISRMRAEDSIPSSLAVARATVPDERGISRERKPG